MGHNPDMSEPVPIGVTLGDPAGVGPEVIEKALASGNRNWRIRLFGPDLLVEKLSRGFEQVTPVPTSTGLTGVVTGQYSRESGQAAMAALQRAVTDFAEGRLGSLVTGPISKVSLTDAGLPHPGQTELVASATGTERFAMMLAGPRLRVTLASTHVALREVAAALSFETIGNAILLTHEFLKYRLRILEPRIGVLGLNPHASDDGRFGGEETTIIRPVVEKLRATGLLADGPLPADTAFHRAVHGEFDALVAMYHDQGLGPLKLYHFEEAINVTLGLPRVRCSPDHGPAFDIAGKDTADATSMLEALRFAAAAIDENMPSPIDRPATIR